MRPVTFESPGDFTFLDGSGFLITPSPNPPEDFFRAKHRKMPKIALFVESEIDGWACFLAAGALHCMPFLFKKGHPTRGSTTRSSNVNLPHTINLMAKCGATSVTSPSDIRGNDTPKFHRVAVRSRRLAQAFFFLFLGEP